MRNMSSSELLDNHVLLLRHSESVMVRPLLLEVELPVERNGAIPTRRRVLLPSLRNSSCSDSSNHSVKLTMLHFCSTRSTISLCFFIYPFQPCHFSYQSQLFGTFWLLSVYVSLTHFPALTSSHSSFSSIPIPTYLFTYV